MGAPESELDKAEQPAAETLLTAFKTISASERRKHASVLNYWLSIRGDKEFPPLHDFDPLEISDFGPSSLLLELMSGGHDGEVRHLGEALTPAVTTGKIIDAPAPSLLASIAKKLPIVAISRDFLAFEDEYETDDGATRCWVTLLPLSSGGAWVDYAYALVSLESDGAEAAEPAEAPAEAGPEGSAGAAEEALAKEALEETVIESEDQTAEEASADEAAGPDETFEPDVAEAASEDAAHDATAPDDAEPSKGPGFARLFEGFAGLTGFYGHSVKVESAPAEMEDLEASPEEASSMEEPSDPAVEEADETEPAAGEPAMGMEPPVEEPVAEIESEPAAGPEPAEPVAEAEISTPALEGDLQSKLAEVRAMADEARQAKLRANQALYEGLGAAYDFALDAEDSPEDYLRLVEAQGLKIQLRSPMKPVVKLAFDGLCDDSTIAQLEAVLAWALKEELPRGSLPGRIEEAGGIGPILNA